MDYGITKTKTSGLCHYCNRVLTRRTGNVIHDNKMQDYVSACRFCLLENPRLGR